MGGGVPKTKQKTSWLKLYLLFLICESFFPLFLDTPKEVPQTHCDQNIHCPQKAKTETFITTLQLGVRIFVAEEFWYTQLRPTFYLFSRRH